MTNPQLPTQSKRRLVAPFGDDPDELIRLRAEFLADLADWILTHPLPVTPPNATPRTGDPRPVDPDPMRLPLSPLDGVKPA